MIWLADGRELGVVFRKDIGFEQVNAWKAGRKLALVWASGRGLALLDPASNKAMPVLSGWGRHPFEIMNDRCQDKDSSTMGIVACIGEEGRRWDSELNLAYKRLLAQIDAPSRSALQQSQREWLRFRDAQITALQRIYSKREGTIQNIEAAVQNIAITRNQALYLNSMIDAYQGF